MNTVYKYFQISQDGSVTNPPSLIHNSSIGVRNEPTEKANQIFVKDMPNIEYTDFLERPFLLISNIFKKAVELYNPNFEYKVVVLSEKNGGKQNVYWHIDLPNVPCFAESDRLSNSPVKAKIIDKSKILLSEVGGLSFFKFQEAAITNPVYIVRLDLAESILRRGSIGFTLKGLAHV